MRIKELDAMRGIAALSVVLFHFTFGFNHNDTNTFFHKGYLGVQLFFIISGFVIFMTFEKTQNIKVFLLGRFTRLYPAYWFACILSFILLKIPVIFNNQIQKSFIIQNITTTDFLFNITMFQQIFKIRNIDGAFWTLYVELCFYISVVFLFALSDLKNIRKYGIFFLIISIIISLLPKEINKGIYNYYPLIKYGHLFYIGIIIYLSQNKDIISKQDNLKLNTTNITKGVLVKKIVIYMHSYSFKYTFLPLGFALISQIIISRSIFDSIVVLFLSLFFFVLINNKAKIQIISNPIFLFLGSISYSLYLLHENIGSFVFNYFETIGITNTYLKIFGTLLLLIPMAYLSYYLFENILRKKLHGHIVKLIKNE